MDMQRKVVIKGVKVADFKDGEFEGTKWFQLIEDLGFVQPKHRMYGSAYMTAVDGGIKVGDTVDLTVELVYFPKNNAFVLGKVIAVEKSKVK